MVKTKSQANRAIDTNNQAMMASIEEGKEEHIPTNEKTTEQDTQLGKDSKRGRIRIIVHLGESPHR
jgi:hypothetical protein